MSKPWASAPKRRSAAALESTTLSTPAGPGRVWETTPATVKVARPAAVTTATRSPTVAPSAEATCRGRSTPLPADTSARAVLRSPVRNCRAPLLSYAAALVAARVTARWPTLPEMNRTGATSVTEGCPAEARTVASSWASTRGGWATGPTTR